MTDTTHLDPTAAQTRIEQATTDGRLTPSAAENLRRWLSQPEFADYVEPILQHIQDERWEALNDVFWTIIPFGTGGRRGRMYPIGSNAINDRTIGESAQGLADYVKRNVDGSRSCAIAYDSRHRSPHFARLCASIMAAAGFRVYFLDGVRSTPELSFAVRHKRASCGIMVTASHNPPSDNAVKVYWSTGGQILPPHDRGIIDAVAEVKQIETVAFDEALADGRIETCQDEIDPAFINAVTSQAFDGPRDLKIIYSPLHGVGATAVMPALAGDGFEQVELFGPHAEPDGDFPNVPGHVANPENPRVFDALVERARQTGAELAMASDPDCDRIGCAAPRSLASTGETTADWATLTGNQIGALLTDFVLDRRRAAGELSPEHYVVKTLVTTDMIARIADSYGVRTLGNLLVGFKWIGGVMDDEGPDRFVFGAEESHGYLVGQYARDKDGAVAAMLLAELAARLKSQGLSLHEKLDELFLRHGCHVESMSAVTMPGAEGMQRMSELMERFRAAPPTSLAGLNVAGMRDYKNGRRIPVGGSPQPLDGPRGDMVMLDLEAEGNYLAIRPSGTEPKVKFYLFAYEQADRITDLDTTRRALTERLDALSADLKSFAGVQ